MLPILAPTLSSKACLGAKGTFNCGDLSCGSNSLALISDADSKICVEEIPRGRVTSYGHIARLLERRM